MDEYRGGLPPSSPYSPCSFLSAASPQFLTTNALWEGKITETLSKPGGRLWGAFPPDRASSVELSRSVDSKSTGRGVSSALAMFSITFSEGFPFPVVRSLRKEIDTPERSDSSCFVMRSSSRMRKTFVKKMVLYKD